MKNMRGRILCLLLLLFSLVVSAQKTLVTIYGEKVLLNKTVVGLGNVDNTSDINKPVTTSQQNALNLKANIAGPAFTGIPTVPTPPLNANLTEIVNTEFVKSTLLSKPKVFQGANSPDLSMGNVSDIYIQTDGTNVIVWYKLKTGAVESWGHEN